MSATRAAVVLGAIPILIGVIYFVLQQAFAIENAIDPAGVTMLIALGFAMGFGMLVILRGARDL
jgi:hypothetical protein